MEKFRIGMYGIAQVMAIAYGVLACGAIFKVSQDPNDAVAQASFNPGAFYRDHGYYLFFIVVAWAIAAAYLSSEQGNHRVDEDDITSSGLGLTIVFAVLGTIMATMCIYPQHLLLPTHP